MYRNYIKTNPCVVEAVTDTTIMVAAGTISLKSTFVTSRSFLNSYIIQRKASMYTYLVWLIINIL